MRLLDPAAMGRFRLMAFGRDCLTPRQTPRSASSHSDFRPVDRPSGRGAAGQEASD